MGMAGDAALDHAVSRQEGLGPDQRLGGPEILGPEERIGGRGEEYPVGYLPLCGDLGKHRVSTLGHRWTA